MKNNFFGNIKDKISKVTAKAYEYEEYEPSEDEEEDYEAQEQEEAADYSESTARTSARQQASSRTARQSYSSSASGYGSSASSGYGSSSSGSAYGTDTSYGAKQGSSYSRQSYTGTGAKQEGSNIYRMDPTYNKPTHTISKVLYFTLDGPEDARNVADAMMKKDSIILAEFSKLSDLDIARVLSFIDGVRYICKAQIEQIESCQLIVPDFIELSGDFYSQVLG